MKKEKRIVGEKIKIGGGKKSGGLPSLVIALLNTVRSSPNTNHTPKTTNKKEVAEDGDSNGENGECSPAIKLPENLEGLMRADHFPCQRHRWNTNEEIAAILISFAHHPEWLSKEVKIRPKSGSMLLYSRKKVRYRRDGYCWKKRKDGKTTREDHMKLKVQGTECIYGCYVHSAILPTFHRRCYWLLQNPDIVLVHYLNVPYPDDSKLIITSNVSMWGDKKEWTKEELISQLRPMFFSEEEPDLNNELELSTAETVEAIVMQLMEKQRLARAASSSELLSSVSGPSSNSNSSNNTSVATPSSSTTAPAANTNSTGNSNPSSSSGPRLSSSSSSGGGGSLSPAIVATVTTGGPSGVPKENQSSRVAVATGGNGSNNERPFLFNLGQFQNGGQLIILNGKPTAVTTSGNGTVTNNGHGTLNLNSNGSSSFMDVTNANEGVGVARISTTSNQTLLIHHHSHQGQQSQQHFVTSSNHGHSHQHTVHHPPTPSPSSAASDGSSHSHHQQELLTLEMSHEELQQTLSANMGLGEPGVGGLEPMSPSADDVFVNLDAFDILADLSDDLGDHHHHHVTHHHHGVSGQEKTTIVDINPEWAYSEGGTKILIVGQFHAAHWDYSVHFGDLPVPAVYLQQGVLKCFCPPHNPGLVPIRVYSNGKQISNNSMVFEYKADVKVNLVPVAPSEASLKLCLIHRMECLEKCFQNFKGEDYGSRSLEDSVVKMCVEMMSCDAEPEAEDDADGVKAEVSLPDDRGLTLLHLASSLGYTRLLLTLLQWKREANLPLIASEVDPGKVDQFGMLPLHWASRQGHLECGIILSHQLPSSLSARDGEGKNAAQIAVARGHVKLASELEKIQNNRSDFSPLPLTTLGFSVDDVCLTSNLRRFHRGSLSDDFGLKDCFFGQPDALSEFSLASTEEESKVLTLAEQIIAAMPERIKKERSVEEMSGCDSQDSSMISSSEADSAAHDFSFEFSERNYRYYEASTPCSSLSPSSSCLQSPCSSFTVDSPQPTTADFCQFLHASAFEQDFSNLTLSDREQRELYEAAKVIQKAYRSYKGRKKAEEEDKEKASAVIIQNYYRRYKQYAYLRQVTQAALVIQSQYRNYCETKRFKKSQDSGGNQQNFRNNSNHPILRTYSQRKQNQAAKKIQQFMRQSKNNIWECDESPKVGVRGGRKREAGEWLGVGRGGGAAPTKYILIDYPPQLNLSN